MHPVITAVKALRGSLGDSQQAFATRVGLSIRAIANYEKDRIPTGHALTALARAADAAGKPEFANVFWDELRQKEVGAVAIDRLEEWNLELGRAEMSLYEIVSDQNLTAAKARKLAQEAKRHLAKLHAEFTRLHDRSFGHFRKGDEGRTFGHLRKGEVK